MHISDVDKQASNLWINGQWCFDDIATLILEDIKSYIASIHFPYSEAEHGCIWEPKVDGNYTVIISYGWLMDRFRHGDIRLNCR